MEGCPVSSREMENPGHLGAGLAHRQTTDAEAVEIEGRNGAEVLVFDMAA